MDSSSTDAARIIWCRLSAGAAGGLFAVFFASQASPAQGVGACDIRETTEAIRQNPRDADNYVTRAACLLRPRPGGQKPPLKNTEAAVQDLEKAIKLDPRNFYARHNYAHAAYLLGYAQVAVDEFTKAILLDPKSARSYMGRGWAYLELCRIKEAAPDFQRAVSLDSSLQTKVATSRRIAAQQTECARPVVAPSKQIRSPATDPYFDHNSDYWRNRRWEERPH